MRNDKKRKPKKGCRLLIAVALLLISVCPLRAADNAETKGKQTSSAVQFAAPCSVTYVKLVEAGADSTLTLYDSATATTSGKTVKDYVEVANGDGQAGGPLSVPLSFQQGVYAVVGGAGAYYFVHVKPE